MRMLRWVRARSPRGFGDDDRLVGAVTGRVGLRPPLVGTVEGLSVVHQDLELSPDAGRAIGGFDPSAIDTALVPNRPEMLGCAAAAGNVAVPLVVLPRRVRRVGPTFGVTAVPLGVPLHLEVVVGVDAEAVRGCAAVEAPAGSRAVEDPRIAVVTVFVEPACGGNDGDAERADGNSHQCHDQTELLAHS